MKDGQWRPIDGFLPGKATACVVAATNNRLFVEALLRMIRTGSPGRDWPADVGHEYGVSVGDKRCAKKGVWERIFTRMSDDPELAYLMVDGRVVRVHQHRAAKKRTVDLHLKLTQDLHLKMTHPVS